MHIQPSFTAPPERWSFFFFLFFYFCIIIYFLKFVAFEKLDILWTTYQNINISVNSFELRGKLAVLSQNAQNQTR